MTTSRLSDTLVLDEEKQNAHGCDQNGFFCGTASVSFSPGGTKIVSGSYDGTIKVASVLQAVTKVGRAHYPR